MAVAFEDAKVGDFRKGGHLVSSHWTPGLHGAVQISSAILQSRTSDIETLGGFWGPVMKDYVLGQ